MKNLSNPMVDEELSIKMLDNRGECVNRIGYTVELLTDISGRKKGDVIHLLPQYDSVGSAAIPGELVELSPTSSGPHARVIRFIAGYSSSCYRDSRGQAKK